MIDSPVGPSRCTRKELTPAIGGALVMLMRFDPFRELDRLTQQAFGTSSRPASMPMDAYRDQDRFVVHFDLPGVDPSGIDLSIEKNVLTVTAERFLGDRRSTVHRQRTPSGNILTPTVPRRDPGPRRRRGHLQRRRVDPHDSCRGASQAPQDRHHVGPTQRHSHRGQVDRGLSGTASTSRSHRSSRSS